MHKKEFGKGSLGGNEIQGMIERGRGSGREWREAMGREGKAKGGEGAAGGGGMQGWSEGCRQARASPRLAASLSREGASAGARGRRNSASGRPPPAFHTHVRTHARIHGLDSCCRVSDSTDIRLSLSC